MAAGGSQLEGMIWALAGNFSAKDRARLVLYEGLKTIAPSQTVAMKVDGHNLFVYDTVVNNTHTWDNRYNLSLSTAQVASIDFADGQVGMEITLKILPGKRASVRLASAM